MIKSSTNSNKSLLQCPCGSGNFLSSCCQIIFNDHAKATTPELLMRSRYSAYALGNISHILSTWDNLYRPPSLTFDERIKWLKLEIVESLFLKTDTNLGYVHFRAIFIENKNLITLSEKSQFIKKNRKWYYQKGETKYETTNVSLKSPCPCGSGKKFKRCCLDA